MGGPRLVLKLAQSCVLFNLCIGYIMASTIEPDPLVDDLNQRLATFIEEVRLKKHPDIDSQFASQESSSFSANNGSLYSEFPCPRLPPSARKPTSVHQLRPGDVDIVAAIGDSYTAGKAAGTSSLTSLLHDYRGLSWSIGGDGTFKTLHSLPNILKEYNPDIYGFSNSIGDYMSLEAGFNVARSGATSTDLAFQTAMLIQKLKNDPFVNVERDWKLITILIGGNDICRSCHSYFNANIYLKHLKSTLDMLKASLPRSFINVVEIMPVELTRQLPRGYFCNHIQNYYCPCAAFPKTEEDFEELIRERKKFQKLTEDLIASGEYETSDDFTVVLQPFYRNASIPRIPGTHEIDYTFFAVDCFHFSAKGQSVAGLSLWNNMLQPVDHKTTDWNGTGTIACPKDSQPFLATRKNSPDLIKAKTISSNPRTTNTNRDQIQPLSLDYSDQIDNAPPKELSNEADDVSTDPDYEKDVKEVKQGVTIMIIATVAVLLAIVVAGVMYIGFVLLRRWEYRNFEYRAI